MRFGLQKLGRFAAGRLQGSKGVRKYDKYMDENALARNLLTAGDIAGATLGGAALLGGGSIGAGFAKAGAGAKSALAGTKGAITSAKGMLTGSKAAGDTAMSEGTNLLSKLKSAEVLGGIAKGLYGERQANRQMDFEREKMDQAQRQFDATLGLKTREADMMAAQEADRKRREDELMAARAAVRAMFGGA